MNTRALYTQQKYNLLREESEGYSKLITELAELPPVPSSAAPPSGMPAGLSTATRARATADEVVANVRSLIGYFELDPNRVLDLVLEALEVRGNEGRACAAPTLLISPPALEAPARYCRSKACATVTIHRAPARSATPAWSFQTPNTPPLLILPF